MRITNTRKKELADIFRIAGLNILDFDTSGDHKEFRIKFKNDYFSFIINFQKADHYYLTIFPVNNTEGYSVGGTWDNTKSRFTQWAKQIATELNTPTGWESFESENFLNTNYEDFEAKFNDAEKLQTRESIIELKEKIKTLELPISTLRIFEKKLDDVSLKVDGLSKFDWKALFIGTIASLIMTLAIPPELNGIIWQYISIAFRGFRLKG